MNLSFVIPHYGIEKSEPLEMYCRITAEGLYRRGIDVTIYTSANGREEGEYIFNGVMIKRFKSGKEEAFPSHLLKKLIEEEKNYDAIVFFGVHNYWNLKEAKGLKGKKVLVPYLYEKVEDINYLSEIFSGFDGLVFITEKEKLNLRMEFKRSEVIEFGINIKTKIEPENFRKKHFILSDYILSFSGEDEIQEIIQNFRILKRNFPFLTLIISGKFSKGFPFDPDIKYIELTEEKERLEGMKGSIFTLFPSKKDILHYFFFESMSLGVPAVVNEKMVTIVDYCLKSNGGLWYSGREEFLELASLLVKDKLLRSEMGRRAQKYIRENHSFERIFLKWKEFLNLIV